MKKFIGLMAAAAVTAGLAVFVPGGGPAKRAFAEDMTGEELTEGAGETIPDGDYYIASAVGKNYLLDLSSSAVPAPDGTNVLIFANEAVNPDTAWNVFHIEYLGNTFYKICQYDSSACLDIASDPMKPGANVYTRDHSGNNSQQWSVEKTNSGYKIRSRCSGHYLAVQGGEAENGRNIAVEENADTAGQCFGFIPYDKNDRPINDGCYTIGTSFDPSYKLDIEGEAGTYGKRTKAHISRKSDDEFFFRYAGSGYYSITEKSTGKALGVVNDTGFLDNNKSVQLGVPKDTRGSLWKVKEGTDGTYYLCNNVSGYMLSSEGGKAEEGAEVQQMMYSAGQAQLWYIEPAAQSVFRKGDVNGDGRIDIEDAVKVIGHVNGVKALTADETDRANVDGNSKVDIEDAVSIIAHVNGVKSIS